MVEAEAEPNSEAAAAAAAPAAAAEWDTVPAERHQAAGDQERRRLQLALAAAEQEQQRLQQALHSTCHTALVWGRQMHQARFEAATLLQERHRWQADRAQLQQLLQERPQDPLSPASAGWRQEKQRLLQERAQLIEVSQAAVKLAEDERARAAAAWRTGYQAALQHVREQADALQQRSEQQRRQ